MKRKIDFLEHAGEIKKALKSGVLLTTAAGGRTNSMTISWGMLGIEWGKPIFVAFIRESRYTKELIDKNPEFTINMPYGAFDSNITGLCGSGSGRDTDKLSAARLTAVEPEAISVPAIKELPLTLECRVVFKQTQTSDALAPEFCEKFYPKNACGSADPHTAYYGEIAAAYIIE